MTTSSIGAKSALVREVRGLADKGFTGSVTATSMGKDIIVYLAAGEVTAIHSPQFAFPIDALARQLTGQTPPPDQDGLLWLSNQGIDPDVLDASVRDWSYGLFASALSWPDVRVAKTRKDTAAHGRFYPTKFASVFTDTATRIRELTENWGIITQVLAEHNLPPRPASKACRVLVPSIAGHALFAGKHPVDELAYTTGTTRHALLKELSRSLMQNVEVLMTIGHGTVELPEFPIPEALESLENEWASTPKSLASEVDEVAASAPVEPLHEPEAEAMNDEQDTPEPEVEYTAEPVVDREPEVVQDIEPDLLDLEPEASQNLISAPVAPAPVITPAPETAPAQTEHGTEHTDVNVLAQWVAQAEGTDEQDLRSAVLRHAAEAATTSAFTALNTLAADVAELEVQHADMLAASAASSAANGTLHDATSEEQAAANALEQVREGGRDHLTRAATSQENLSAAHARHREAIAAVKAAEAQLAAMAAELENAQNAATEADAAVESKVGPALRAAQAALEEVHNELVEPASQSALEARESLDAAVARHREVRARVDVSGRGSALAVQVVADLDSQSPELNQLTNELGELRTRANQVADLSEPPSTPVAPVEPQFDRTGLEGLLDDEDDDDDQEETLEVEDDITPGTKIPAPMAAPTTQVDFDALIHGTGADTSNSSKVDSVPRSWDKVMA
ncbi:hypothetical protein V5R04_06730 [Jonesiaceae bacterium BS-20]|uniref:Uncharacterized protein n=1 Tax=Jonesiaceae bacterium BS-20 TaxID=3120821 RepID=A0AAU7E0T0_9MICO